MTQVNVAKEKVLSINVGTTPLPLPDGSCQLVYTSHMLEHLMHPAQTRLVMEEVHRVLAPGGTVRVVVPDASVWLQGYAQQDPLFLASVRTEWPLWDWAALDSANGSSLDYILPYLGASSLHGHLAGDHQFGFDEQALKGLMINSGFDEAAVKRCSYQQSVCSDLRVDHISEAAAVKMQKPHTHNHPYTEPVRVAGTPTLLDTYTYTDTNDIYFSLFIEATKSLTPSRPLSSASSSSFSFSSSSPRATTESNSSKGGRVRRALQWLVKRIFAPAR